MTLIERSKEFMSALGLPTTRFCKLVKISTSTWYRALSGENDLSDEMEDRIEEVLQRYGY